MKKTEWSIFSGVCEGCGKTFRISRDALNIYLNEHRKNEKKIILTAEDIEECIQSFQFCIQCVSGDACKGEFEIPKGTFILKAKDN